MENDILKQAALILGRLRQVTDLHCYCRLYGIQNENTQNKFSYVIRELEIGKLSN